MEWNALLQTQGGYQFMLGLFAFSEGNAKSKAKKLSQGCKVISIKSMTSLGTSLIKDE